MPLTPISTHQKDSRRSLSDTFPNERDCGSTMCTSAAAEGLRAPHTHLVWNFCTIEYRRRAYLQLASKDIHHVVAGRHEMSGPKRLCTPSLRASSIGKF